MVRSLVRRVNLFARLFSTTPSKFSNSCTPVTLLSQKIDTLSSTSPGISSKIDNSTCEVTHSSPQPFATFQSPFSFSNIDSHSNILHLENASFTRQQSEAVVEIMHDLVAARLQESSNGLLSVHKFVHDIADLESAQKTLEMELVRELGMKSIEGKANRESILTKVQDLNDRIRESLNMLKSDCQSLLNDYKNVNRESEQEIDIELHKITGMLTVAEGNFKAKLESVKLKAISLFSGFLLSIFVIVIGERALFGGSSSGKTHKQSGGA